MSRLLRCGWLWVLVPLLMISCRPGAEAPSDTEAFTNRPQNQTHFIAIIKLESPALLTTATKQDGVTVVDETLKATILAEQEAYEAELQAISPEIKILNRYRLVLNGLAILAPKSVEDQIRGIAGTSYVEGEKSFSRLETEVTPGDADQGTDLSTRNSVSFIGAHQLHNLGITGAGQTVGIIDTGIDYTHSMFGGPGTVDAFEANDPTIVEDGTFPTAKVVGGIDLVGKDYNSGAPDFARHIPVPDADPLDDGSHGTHVAGTVAGLGNGVSTYDGVAPGAALHAIKVFGENGSTGDTVIIAALEYAADPDGDLNPADQLDVVNLSLGSSFGTPHILYSEAMKNLIDGGTVAVASGGNSGHFNYIVGAPGTTLEAISVAASVDDMDHNWQFPAVEFVKPGGDTVIAKAVEGVISKPISDAGNVSGKLVAVGLADADFSDDLVAALNTHVALIDRGAVTFCEKAQRVLDAGAIGFVVVTNNDGEPISMGGDCEIGIPGVMITKALGESLKEAMGAGDTIINFGTDRVIEEPELIDTLTSFSSRGPRSIDAVIKPEVAAPGSQIISARSGTGDEAIRMSGTSMAAPHVAGLAALLRAAHQDKTPAEIKSLIVQSATSITDAEGEIYPVAQQGAGRVQAAKAVAAPVVVFPTTLSIGQVLVEQRKVLRKSLQVKNISDEALVLQFKTFLDEGFVVEAPEEITLAAGESKSVSLRIDLKPTYTDHAAVEMDGVVTLVAGEAIVARIPALAVATKAARIEPKKLEIFATSDADSAGALAELTVENVGRTSGEALPFNLIAEDDRNLSAAINQYRNGICDLQSSGYRIVKKEVGGETVQQLQVAVKLFHPVTTWNVCEVSVQLDGDGDGIADQELLGTPIANYFAGQPDNVFGSLLMDGDRMRQIRREFEESYPDVTQADYSVAALALEAASTYDHSTLAVLTANLSDLARTPDGQLLVKIAVIGDISSPTADDFLAEHDDSWHLLPVRDDAIAFVDLPESIALEAGETRTVELTKGGAGGDLILYLPHNRSNFSTIVTDDQGIKLEPEYAF